MTRHEHVNRKPRGVASIVDTATGRSPERQAPAGQAWRARRSRSGWAAATAERVRDDGRAMIDDRLVLRLPGLHRAYARELAEAIGAEATIVQEDPGPAGGYGDLGSRTVAVIVTARALRAVARYLAARQHSHDETVSLAVQIGDPDGIRRDLTLTYKAAPGQSTAEAAATALRALPGVGEALERSMW